MNTTRRHDAADFHPSQGQVPTHVGLIPDGARRWARREAQSLEQSYHFTMDKLGTIVEWLFANHVEALSIYLSSSQNFRRSRDEIAAFCDAEAELCNRVLPPLTARFGTRVTVAGDLDAVPEQLSIALHRAVSTTSTATRTRLYLCVAYNPLREVFLAAKSASSVDDLVGHLQVPEPLDLVIRTGGTNTISNFLPLQGGFARLTFLDRLFNDIEISDIASALSELKGDHTQYGQ